VSQPPPRQSVKVGLFVTGALGVLAAGVFTIGDLNDSFTPKIPISAVFDEVSGLQGGDSVWFSGVKVGRVTRLAFRSGSQVVVEMKVDRNAAPFIHRGSLARIGTDGLIGSQIVVLYDSPPDGPPLQAGDVLDTETSLSAEDMMGMLQETNLQVLAISKDVQRITSGLAAGEGTVGRLLRDDALYEDLAASGDSVNRALVDARAAAASAATFAARLDRPGTLPHDLVTDTTTHAALTRAVAQVDRAGERAADLMDGLATGAADPDTALGALVGDKTAGAGVKRTMAHLEEGSLALTEDLEAIQQNRLMRRYLKRRARDREAEAAAARD
jgi:phospholipid/cholesterol/gamma-HCH transport system substrate-binding protein